MGKKGKEIVGSAREEIVNMLKKAYADEMVAFHFYWYTSIYMEGLGFATLTTLFKNNAMGELKHAEMLADRLNQLGAFAFSNPGEWLKNSNVGTVEPEQYLTFKKSVQKAMEIAGIVAEHYNKIMHKVKDVDFVTYEIVSDILAEEVKEEQDLEDILSQLEF
ncbi:MAG: ferritin-like domain-containing protein [Nitrososphaerales archaeon]